MLSGSLTTAGIWVAAIGLVGILIRQIGPWNRQAHQAEVQLRNDLMRRVRRLESGIERERTIHKAEIQMDRHRLNNITGCFDALLLLIEMAPEKAAESVRRIKEMRSRQMGDEAAEKATIRAAEITALAEIEAENAADELADEAVEERS